MRQPKTNQGTPVSSRPLVTPVFLTQMVTSAAFISVVIVVYVLDADRLASAAAFWGLLAIGCASLAAGTVNWQALGPSWSSALPLLDIAAIVLLHSAAPMAGFSVLLIFPIYWMASSFGRAGSVIGPTVAVALLIGSAFWAYAPVTSSSAEVHKAGTIVSLFAVLLFAAAVISLSLQRLSAQRILLQRQTSLLEDALERTRFQEQRQRDLLDAVDFSVILLDDDGRAAIHNQASLALAADLGISETTRLDQLPAYREDRVTPLQLHEFPHLRALRGESVPPGVFWLGHPGEQRVALNVSFRRLGGKRTKNSEVVLVARDVTGEANAIQARDDLVTSVSHELRTPLTSILGYLDLAREDPTTSGEVHAMLDIAFKNANRMLALVSDFLTVRSRGADTTISLKIQECDLGDIVAEAVEAISLLATERLISVDLDPAPKATIHADPLRIRQVVDNLLSNSIKYNQFGGRIHISLDAASTPAGVPIWQLLVADSGRGMTDEEQKGLFERFYRAESVRGSTIHGTGLGLSITREIVELHHGTISIDSKYTLGTTATVRLPRTDLKEGSA